MTTETFDGIRLIAKANMYFDGKRVSHSFILPDGTEKLVGIVPSTMLTFGVAVAEIVECVGGSCEYKLDDTDEWRTSDAGDSFQVPASSKFDIRVTEAYHYIRYYV